MSVEEYKTKMIRFVEQEIESVKSLQEGLLAGTQLAYLQGQLCVLEIWLEELKHA